MKDTMSPIGTLSPASSEWCYSTGSAWDELVGHADFVRVGVGQTVMLPEDHKVPLPLPLAGDSGTDPREALVKALVLDEDGQDRTNDEEDPFPDISPDEFFAMQAKMGRTGAPVLGSWLLPTIGSAGHPLRICKPCAFVNTKGCKDGVQCRFCHLCEVGEKKRRKKEKSTFLRTARRWQRHELTAPQATEWN